MLGESERIGSRRYRTYDSLLGLGTPDAEPNESMQFLRTELCKLCCLAVCGLYCIITNTICVLVIIFLCVIATIYIYNEMVVPELGPRAGKLVLQTFTAFEPSQVMGE